MSLEGIDYLKNERHLTDETIKMFNLGYCDGVGTLYTNCDLTNMLTQLDNRFYNTSLFPIYDLYNNLIGISARNLRYNSNQDIKYINTVYSKTSHLFGLNVTWKDCLKANSVYVVEGNVDALMMYQFGVKNVVGMLGSILKMPQFCLLSRFVDKVVLVPDGDKAGTKFLARMRDSIAELQKNINFDVVVNVVHLPEGYDPDKFLREKGKDEFYQLDEYPVSGGTK